MAFRLSSVGALAVALATACCMEAFGDGTGGSSEAGLQAARDGGSGRGGVGGDVFTFENRLVHQFGDSYDWGFLCGVKQPFGAFKDGLSIHLIDKPHPTETLANPDHIFWVNEVDGTYGVSTYATGQDAGWHIIPGGMVTFDDDGTIWCNLGGRAKHLPLDLYRSDSPYDVENFTLMVEDYETAGNSTDPCVLACGSKVAMFWRQGGSAQPTTTMRMRRYNIDNGGFEYEGEYEIAKGVLHGSYGPFGIEQLWVRFDPRYGYMFASWEWLWDYPGPFGALPFIYSDDFGDNWRTADGAAIQNLPVVYSDGDNKDILIPYDHFELGGHSDWNPRDLGVSPHGTFWITVPEGAATQNNNWKPLFWLFNGKEWEQRALTGYMEGWARPYSVGVTKDFLVLLYSDLDARDKLKARVSADDGYTWSEPVVVDEVPIEHGIPWVSFAQPHDDYVDNSVRFFYSYYKLSEGTPGKKSGNNIRWIKFDIIQAFSGDRNRHGRSPASGPTSRAGVGHGAVFSGEGQ